MSLSKIPDLYRPLSNGHHPKGAKCLPRLEMANLWMLISCCPVLLWPRAGCPTERRVCFLGRGSTHNKPALRVSYDSNKLRGQGPRDRTKLSLSTCRLELGLLGLLGKQEQEESGLLSWCAQPSPSNPQHARARR